MSKLSEPNCDAALLVSLPLIARELIWKRWSGSEQARFLEDFWFWSSPEQRAPDGDWRTWLFLGGRGAGKTRAGAEWVSYRAREGLSRRIALIGPTFHDVREVMLEGGSGILSLPHERPIYEPSRRRLVWRNGAQAQCFSAEDPDGLRGPQFDAAWCDELCYWTYPEQTLATLAHALRLGDAPLTMVTTTPRPIPALKRLMAEPNVVLSNAGTLSNRANLAPGFIASLRQSWRGTVRERQEILGELIEDPEGALWTRALVDAARSANFERPDRIVVAVDPPASMGAKANACGIVAAGAYGAGGLRRAVVMADASVQGLASKDWAERAASLARALGAAEIVAEANNGGELVRAVLALAAPDVPIRLVRAALGKRERAAPVAIYYTQRCRWRRRRRAASKHGSARDELRGFLRGQLGSAHAMRAPHPVGARIVKIDARLARVEIAAHEWDDELTFVAPPAGAPALSTAAARTNLPLPHAAARPWPPAHVRAKRVSGGDVHLSWVRRARTGDHWGAGDPPLGFPSEGYQLQIHDGAVIKRTLAVSTPAYAYSAADQTLDFGAPPASLRVKVAQIDAAGAPALNTELTIPL